MTSGMTLTFETFFADMREGVVSPAALYFMRGELTTVIWAQVSLVRSFGGFYGILVGRSEATNFSCALLLAAQGKVGYFDK